MLLISPRGTGGSPRSLGLEQLEARLAVPAGGRVSTVAVLYLLHSLEASPSLSSATRVDECETRQKGNVVRQDKIVKKKNRAQF